MSETTKATLSVFTICLIVWGAVVGTLMLIYPNDAIEVDTTGMSYEQIKLLELWMQ